MRPTPVYMTVAGPKMMELAGEVADGAMMLVGLHPRAIAAARRRLETGARRAGRELKDFQTIFITPMTVDEDGQEARRWPQRWFQPGQPYLKYPSKANLDWLRESGIDLPDDFVPEEITDGQAAEICDAFGLFGTAEEWLDRRKRAAGEADVERVFVFPSQTRAGVDAMPGLQLAAYRQCTCLG